MMVAKRQKFDWMMIFFIFPSSSHNFQSLTVNSRFVRVPALFFLRKNRPRIKRISYAALTLT